MKRNYKFSLLIFILLLNFSISHAEVQKYSHARKLSRSTQDAIEAAHFAYLSAKHCDYSSGSIVTLIEYPSRLEMDKKMQQRIVALKNNLIILGFPEQTIYIGKIQMKNRIYPHSTPEQLEREGSIFLQLTCDSLIVDSK